MSQLQPHIKCKKGDVAKIVLLPGSPERAQKIVRFFDTAKKISDNRGLPVYTGKYHGTKLSVACSGMGCPSAAIVVEELANIGVEVFIRVGTCGALKQEIKAGDLIIPFAAIRAEGTTREYVPAELPAVADFTVTNFLKEAAEKFKYRYFTGLDRCHDAFYEHLDNMLKWGQIFRDKRMSGWKSPLVSSEMECSVVFLLPLLRGLRAGAVLAVNTTEPLDKIAANPDLIYQLIETPGAKDGEARAIKVALEAAKKLADKENL